MKLIWLIVAVLFGIAEMLTPSLTLIWFSVGAVVLIFLSSFIESIFLQILIFAVISIAMLILATKKIIKKDKGYKSNTNLQAMISKRGIVTEEISPNNTGLVVVEHETWTAISIDGEKIEKDSTVEVLKIEGVKLVVKKVNATTSVTNQ